MDRDGLPSFSIVIPTFRRPDALAAALESVARLDYPSELVEVIVVDDEGAGRAAKVLEGRQMGPICVSVESQRQGGAAAARNRGAANASGELLLFLDDDILIDADHLHRHAKDVSSTRIRLVNGSWTFTAAVESDLMRTPFGRYRIALEQSFHQSALGVPLTDGLVEMQTLGSWDLSVARVIFEGLGGFDESFPVAGAEDQDFSIRARELGAQLLLDTAIVCRHNDNRLTLADYCRREERNASTMPFLVRKHPTAFRSTRYVVENCPVRPTDPLRLVGKKLLKKALQHRLTLSALHQVVHMAEKLRVPEPALQRLYASMLGLYLYRGFRSTYRK